MEIDSVPKEIVVLQYLQVVEQNGATTVDIECDLDKSYRSALNRLSGKFGNEIDIRIGPMWKHRYFINETGKKNLELWKENNKELGAELEEMYVAKFIEKIIDYAS